MRYLISFLGGWYREVEADSSEDARKFVETTPILVMAAIEPIPPQEEPEEHEYCRLCDDGCPNVD